MSKIDMDYTVCSFQNLSPKLFPKRNETRQKFVQKDFFYEKLDGLSTP